MQPRLGSAAVMQIRSAMHALTTRPHAPARPAGSGSQPPQCQPGQPGLDQQLAHATAHATARAESETQPSPPRGLRFEEVVTLLTEQAARATLRRYRAKRRTDLLLRQGLMDRPHALAPGGVYAPLLHPEQEPELLKEGTDPSVVPDYVRGGQASRRELEAAREREKEEMGEETKQRQVAALLHRRQQASMALQVPTPAPCSTTLIWLDQPARCTPPSMARLQLRYAGDPAGQAKILAIEAKAKRERMEAEQEALAASMADGSLGKGPALDDEAEQVPQDDQPPQPILLLQVHLVQTIWFKQSSLTFSPRPLRRRTASTGRASCAAWRARPSARRRGTTWCSTGSAWRGSSRCDPSG